MSPVQPNEDKAEPFPSLSPVTSSNAEDEEANDHVATAPQQSRRRRTSSSAAGGRRTRGASLLQSMMESNPPLGAWHAIGEDTAKGPTIPEIKNGSYSAEGWSHEGQLEKRHFHPHDIHKRRLSRASSQSKTSRSTRPATAVESKVVPEETEISQAQEQIGRPPHAEDGYARDVAVPLGASQTTDSLKTSAPVGPNEAGEYPNGYRFPKKHTWQQSFAIFGKAFWKFFWTIKGFLITIYGLNVVAWGAMIFFLLIPGATPAMCKSYPDCEDKRYSARQIWIENCSQILTALFCVTAFGLLPWRLRDFYYMIRYQAMGDYDALRRLAGYYRGWYRLPGSDKLPESLGPPPEPVELKARSLFSAKRNKKEQDVEMKEADLQQPLYTDEDVAGLQANPAVALPPWSMPPAPLTGIRARPTKFSSLAWMIWMYIWNTLFQVGLCVVMWGYNRFERNKGYFTALTALFIVMGCATGIVAGIIVGKEGKVIKETEGIPVKDYDVPETAEDYQERITKENKKKEKKSAKRHSDSER
ncbi:hypothetical protein PMZ80_009005 [Knufia obscura]|uniref:Uncharacterized protein n=2 Tax=Knufia TaxID=430999 RepID=A0AAN8EGH5_9EURO|nr:hypothetical protein PMZ80_009005 [Knufia obscura]KAK5955038.1 hypothetical protein OHC33_003717 [Knufia fluminis]